MTLCSLMVSDFAEGTGRYSDTGEEYYDDTDLEFGAAWANSLIEMGYRIEPFYEFDLCAFGEWCRALLEGHEDERQ